MFQVIFPGDNPNQGKDKINYNFNLISGYTDNATLTIGNKIFGGSPGQILYTDSNGSLFSDSGFTHSLTGGTLSYVKPEYDIEYGLVNGSLDFLIGNNIGNTGNTGSALYYNDASHGRNWSNFIGVIDNISLGETIYNNNSVLIWADNSGTQGQAIVSATQTNSGATPLITLQSQILDEFDNLDSMQLDMFPTILALGYFTGITSAQTLAYGIEISKSGYTNFTSSILSGGTDLYDIFSTTGGDGILGIEPGLNTYTGGTSTNPTINISSATLTSLYATTLSGGTILSGSTDLYNIFYPIPIIQPEPTLGISNVGVSGSTSLEPGSNNSGGIMNITVDGTQSYGTMASYNMGGFITAPNKWFMQITPANDLTAALTGIYVCYPVTSNATFSITQQSVALLPAGAYSWFYSLIPG